MPDFDYTELVNTAAELVSDFGRDVTLVQLDDLDEDPTMPWRGPVNPRGVPKATLTRRCTNVEPSSLERLGIQKIEDDLLKRTDKVVMFGGNVDLSAYHEVIDNDERFRITFTRVLQPGPVRLLTFMGLRR